MCSLLTRPRRADVRTFDPHALGFALFGSTPIEKEAYRTEARVFGMALRLLVAVGAIATAQGALELDMDNWNSALAGKSAFVKFLAPW